LHGIIKIMTESNRYHAEVVVFNAIIPMALLGMLYVIGELQITLYFMSFMYLLTLFLVFMERWLGKPRMVYDVTSDAWIMEYNHKRFMRINLEEYGIHDAEVLVYSPFSDLCTDCEHAHDSNASCNSCENNKNKE